MDYLQEPDFFHDVFGHVPILMNPLFADYLQRYGEEGLKALRLEALPYLARLYWYTVEFGLIRTEAGLLIYGSGIVSSRAESIHFLESAKQNRTPFDLMRVMQKREERRAGKEGLMTCRSRWSPFHTKNKKLILSNIVIYK